MSKTEKDSLIKQCTHCGKDKSLTFFFDNPGNTIEFNKDFWCQDCFRQIKTKPELIEYFWQNNREWDDRYWESAAVRADALLSKNVTYSKLSRDKKTEMRTKIICQQVGPIINKYYKYVQHELSYEDAVARGDISVEDETKKIWSDEWWGNFTEKELKYLDKYYQNLEKDHDFSDETNRDYGHQISKASLNVNKAQDDYAAGRCDYSVVKDAITVYDTLNKSANLAACKRKPGDNAGISSWGEMALYLETHGRPMIKQIEFPPDDVTRRYDAFAHLVEALNLD